MPLEQVAVLGILVATLIVLATDRLSPGITGLLIIAALATTGLLDLDVSFEVLANPAVVALAGMFVISAGVKRTGLAARLANLATGGGASPRRAYLGLVLMAAAASAFVNNTPLVLVFIPVVLGMSKTMAEPPSKLLIPLSYATVMGGACTLIGTSTNLVVAAALVDVSNGGFELHMFDFAPVGLTLAVVGTATMFWMRRRLLPDRVSMELPIQDGTVTEYMTQIVVDEGSELVGEPMTQIFRRRRDPSQSTTVLQLIRDQVVQQPDPAAVLLPGDIVLMRGEPKHIIATRKRFPSADEELTGEVGSGRVQQTLFEVLVVADSAWIGKRIRQIRLKQRYGLAVFAVRRQGGAHLRESLPELRIRAGDMLLVQGTPQSIRHLRASPNALVVEGVDRLVPKSGRGVAAFSALVLFVLLAVLEVVPVHLAALIAALFTVLSRCLTAREAYDSLAWEVLFLIAGTLALGSAFEQTGLAADLAGWIGATFGGLGPHATVAAIFCVTAALTQTLSNNAAAALMTPLAYEIGLLLQVGSPLATVLAVAFGANACFLTPMAYQTNLMVYGPGGYRFGDFAKAGAPLMLIYAVGCTLLLPWLY